MVVSQLIGNAEGEEGEGVDLLENYFINAMLYAMIKSCPAPHNNSYN
jgi:hypothetical protein